MQIVFNVSESSGEAKISPASVRKIAHYDGLWRADVLKDIIYDATELYEQALEDFADEFEQIRVNAGLGKPCDKVSENG